MSEQHQPLHNDTFEVRFSNIPWAETKNIDFTFYDKEGKPIKKYCLTNARLEYINIGDVQINYENIEEKDIKQ